MSKLNDNLEILSPSARFFDKKSKKKANSKISESIGSLFLQKREMIEADDFNEIPLKRQRGISDAIIPDTKIINEANFDHFRRRRSTLLGFKEPPNLPLDNLDLLEAEIENEGQEPEEPVALDKPKNRKKKDNDAFNFDEFTNKKKRDTKLVMKLDKTTENIKLNDKSKGRGRKRKNQNETKSFESFNRTDRATNEDDPDKRQMGCIDEGQRLKTKINKVKIYWQKRSLHIPNVFRLARLIDDDSKYLFEFQDHSKKSVLVQGTSHRDKSNNSYKSTSEQMEPVNDAMSFVQRRSFNMILGMPEEMMNFFK